MSEKSTTEKGLAAQSIAERYYLDQGYTLLCRNFRWKRGEIDLVMECREHWAIVEVKLRERDWEQSAWSPLWRGKLHRLRTGFYLLPARFPHLRRKEMRIDIVFVTQGRVMEVFEAV